VNIELDGSANVEHPTLVKVVCGGCKRNPNWDDQGCINCLNARKKKNIEVRLLYVMLIDETEDKFSEADYMALVFSYPAITKKVREMTSCFIW